MLEPDKPNFILLGKVATNNFTSLLFFRYIFGPTPLFLCNFNLFLKRTLTAQFMMFMDAIMISRFMFIFVLRNPSAFQDDFWSLFGNIWILSFCCIGQIVSELMLGCENLNTNICSGKYIYISSDCLKVTRNDRFNGSIALFTLIVHVFVNIKIQIFKWKRPADQHQISQRTKLSWRNFRESKFFSNVIMTTINSILAKSIAILPAILKKLTFDENHDNLYDVLNRLVRIPLTLLLVIANAFFFHRDLLDQILKLFS